MNKLNGHTIREVVLDEAMEAKQLHVTDIHMDKGSMAAVVLSDGSKLMGIVDGQVNIMPDHNTVVLSIALEGPFTFNGKPAIEAFTKARAEQARENIQRVVEVVRDTRIVVAKK